eukprot:scaffold819_cov350-Prasinococcus_capsulatus_cf.AAC.9
MPTAPPPFEQTRGRATIAYRVAELGVGVEGEELVPVAQPIRVRILLVTPHPTTFPGTPAHSSDSAGTLRRDPHDGRLYRSSQRASTICRRCSYSPALASSSSSAPAAAAAAAPTATAAAASRAVRFSEGELLAGMSGLAEATRGASDAGQLGQTLARNRAPVARRGAPRVQTTGEASVQRAAAALMGAERLIALCCTGHGGVRRSRQRSCPAAAKMGWVK